MALMNNLLFGLAADIRIPQWVCLGAAEPRLFLLDLNQISTCQGTSERRVLFVKTFIVFPGAAHKSGRLRVNPRRAENGNTGAYQFVYDPPGPNIPPIFPALVTSVIRVACLGSNSTPKPGRSFT